MSEIDVVMAERDELMRVCMEFIESAEKMPVPQFKKHLQHWWDLKDLRERAIHTVIRIRDRNP